MTEKTSYPLVYRGVPVPFIASWDSETPSGTTSPDLVLRKHEAGGAWLLYLDEQPNDRQYGVLWTRVPWSPGAGRPQFAGLHAIRQRMCLSRGRCQICSGPADLWMVPATVYAEYQATCEPGEPFESHNPPICRSCVPLAARFCSHLSSTGYLFLAPRTWQVTAVSGAVADPAAPGGFSSSTTTVPLSGPDQQAIAMLLRRTLAKGLVAALTDFQVFTDPEACPGLGERLPPVKPAVIAPVPHQRERTWKPFGS